jgi:hyperosmotically inducible periplasmic protein
LQLWGLGDEFVIICGRFCVPKPRIPFTNVSDPAQRRNVLLRGTKLPCPKRTRIVEGQFGGGTLKRFWLSVYVATALGSTLACTDQQQRSAEEKTRQADRDIRDAAAITKEEARRLATETKQEAKTLGNKMDSALNHHSPRADSAGDKMHAAGDKARAGGARAKTELDDAALTTRVKAALANDVGLKTLTGVNVDSSGSVVTLSGSVQNTADKEKAERIASSVSGVSRVVNRLAVQ